MIAGRLLIEFKGGAFTIKFENMASSKKKNLLYFSKTSTLRKSKVILGGGHTENLFEIGKEKITISILRIACKEAKVCSRRITL
jgi:hypothetical protein